MAMQTGENEQAMRKILDMTRLISIILLALHCYYYLYAAFDRWQLTWSFGDRILNNIRSTGLYQHFHTSKLIALLFLAISLLGAKGKKEEKLNYRTAFAYLITGLLFYFISGLSLRLAAAPAEIAAIYITLLATGYLLILSGGTLLSRIIKEGLKDDIFNEDNETFPQETRLITNEFSVNLPTKFRHKGKIQDGFLNVISPQRGVICQGSAGAGKTAYFLRHVITQSLGKEKPFSALIYDFKFPDLSIIAYNHWLRNKHKYGVPSDCIFINFDDLSRSHRLNVFDPLGMTDITDASESARTILLGLNRQWQTRQGDFFVESAINFVTAVIWFLRKYDEGRYCTLPHAIELIQQDYDILSIVLIKVFVNAKI